MGCPLSAQAGTVSPDGTVVLDRYPPSLRGGVERVRQIWRVALHPKFRPEIRLLRAFIPAGCGCLDIGANHGRFTLELARTGARVIAFEPLAFNLAIIRPATALSRRVRVEPVALGDADGETCLYVPLRRDGRPVHGAGFVAENDEAARVRALDPRVVRQPVRIRRLDAMDLSWAGPIGFIKMDVEGHEAAVIRGAGKVLADHRPSILMEVAGDPPGLESLRELAASGFVLRDLDLREAGGWDEGPDAIHAGVVAAAKSHDILAWHGSRGSPPELATPFDRTRFGR